MNDKEVQHSTPDSSTGFPLVGIGASAGGLKALKEFFQEVPPDSGMAYVVIVHLSEDHESALAEILQGCTTIPVRQVTETVKVRPDHVYVIPPTKNLALVDGHIRLTERGKGQGRQMPINLFFRNLADAYGRDAFAIVLSGAGNDGTFGLARVKEQGGVAMVQDPDDAEYDSMPRSAIRTNLVDVVLPAASLPRKILAIRDLDVELHEQTERVIGQEKTAEIAGDPLREVLTIVRMRTGHDFANYKRPTLLRRLARRLQVNELSNVDDYVKLLRVQPEEVVRLQRDLLITVTNFFRDKEAFVYLEEHVIPKLFEGKSGQDSVRVWSCGCGTGEEAYSLGMLLLEYSARLADPPKLQIFASDINEDAIRTARECLYPDAIASDIEPGRLKRFFNRRGEMYCVKKELRDLVLFAPHNVLRDPPFSQLDLVSCRNLLIYLNRDTQARVMELFSFALRKGGFLFLGNSEAADSNEGLFVPVEKNYRVYKNIESIRRRPAAPVSEIGRWEIKFPEARHSGRDSAFSYSSLHHRVAEEYAPPSVLINEEYEVVHMSERAGRFMRFSGGEPTRSLLKTIHPALQIDLRAAVIAAKQERGQVEIRNINLAINDQERRLNLVVRPVELPDAAATYFLVVFNDERGREDEEEGTRAVFEALSGDSALEAVVHRIEDELQETKERLRLTVEHGEISTEELKASNEELQAINEELRSATEELETSKEELQSVNEELTTVNNELKEKITEISDVNSDLQNLMHSTDIGTIFLDRNLKIKRYTRKVEKLFNIISSDVGRPLEHLTHHFAEHDLTTDAREVLHSLAVVERELRLRDEGGCYLARLSPYRTLDDRIEGVVISFVDITELKRATDRLGERDFLLRIAQDAAKAGVWTLNLKNGGAWWSDECFQLHEKEPGSIEMSAENWISRMHPQDAEKVREAIGEAVKLGTKYSYELKLDSPSGERWILEVGRAIYDQAGKAERIAGISLDVTERVSWQHQQSELMQRRELDERTLREADRRKNEFLATLAHELRNPLAPIRTGLEIMRLVDDPKQVAETTAVIERQVDQIVHLVDDLLDLSRITEGKIRLQLQRIKLSDALRCALESVEPTMKETGHQLTVTMPDDPVFVTADRVRIAQIFLNLLNNAAKFTEPGGRISLSAVRDGSEVLVSVSDNGVGMSPEVLPRIFDMFTQGGDVQRPHGGLGIGLSLVKKLVDLHGGTVTAHSEGLGRGTEMRVRLPLATEEAPSPMPEPPPPPVHAASGAIDRVLVVDDNRDAADMLKILLGERHEVAVAYDGAEALEVAESFRPQAVLLDIGLPNMNGCEVAAQLRERMPDILLIAISGWGQSADRERTKEAGFDHHLVKPVQIEEVERLLGP